mgnify:CR=1 FL=1
MDWIQILSLFLANAGLIIWFRTESRNDWKHMDSKVDAIQVEMKDFHIKMANQDKDFHVKMAAQDLEFKMRLCAIEEKNKGNKK